MEQSLIWEHFQNAHQTSFSGSHSRINTLISYAFKVLQAGHENKSPRILNIGVGDGYCEKAIMQRGVVPSCIDPSENAINRLKSLGCDAVAGSISELPFKDGTFDTIICTEVLEHLDNQDLNRGLAEIYRCLKKGGSLIGTVPFNEKLDDHVAVCPSCDHKFHRWGHVQSFTKDALMMKFKERAFNICRIRVQTFPDWTKKGAMKTIRNFVLYILGKLGEPIVSPNLFFHVRK